MWGLFVVVFYLSSADANSRVVGSFELRMSSQEQCLRAREQMEKNWNYDKHRIHTSCTFKGYL